MCDEDKKKKKKKCKSRTHSLLKEEKSRVMKETLEHLKSLRDILETKQVA